MIEDWKKLAAKAAAIIEAALTQNEMNHGSGGVAPLAKISPETNTKLTGNVELMRRLGFSGTPGLVARGSDGELIVQTGALRGATLEALFGPL